MAAMLAVGVCLVVCSMALIQIAHFDASHASESKPTEPQKSETSSENNREFHTELIRGHVVWLAEALKDNFGISTVPEVEEQPLAILSGDGQLFPIVENLRGQAFRKDERLRDMEIEILARRYERQPFIQVLRVYEIDDGKRYEVDYWCDVCAIVMFETGPCACCQDDNRLRKRLISNDDID
jgi:hypothetical protein